MIGRREFIAGLGAAAWPFTARTQQLALPLVGIVDITTLGISFRQQALSAFRRGLNETGYIEGRNVAIEYHTVAMQLDRVLGLAADLLHRQVAVIFAIGPRRWRAPTPLSNGGARRGHIELYADASRGVHCLIWPAAS